MKPGRHRTLRLTVLVAALAPPLIASATVLEFTSTRRTFTTLQADPSAPTEVFVQAAVPGQPPLTDVAIFNDTRFQVTGEGSDSVRGRYAVHAFAPGPAGYGIYSGWARIADEDDGWMGGTGNYAGTTGRTAFAGFGRTRDGINETNTTDFAYQVSPGIASPAFVEADLSPAGSGPDTSVFTDAARGTHDVSFRLTRQSYASGDTVTTALPTVGPAGFNLQTHHDDPAGSGDLLFEWTGPGGAVLGGTLAFFPDPLADVPVPPGTPGAPRRTLITGMYTVRYGHYADQTVVGGSLVFSGLDRYDNMNTAAGTVDLAAYGWIEVRPVPEPATWVTTVAGLVLLAGTAGRSCRRPRGS